MIIPPCPGSPKSVHHWKENQKFSRQLANSSVIVYGCKWCQMLKTKVLTFEPMPNGTVRQIVKDIFPEGQSSSISPQGEAKPK